MQVERLDVWKSGDEVRALTAEKREVLERMREVVRSEEVLEVPSLKSVERGERLTGKLFWWKD